MLVASGVPGRVCCEGEKSGDSTEGGHHPPSQHSLHHFQSSAPYLHSQRQQPQDTQPTMLAMRRPTASAWSDDPM